MSVFVRDFSLMLTRRGKGCMSIQVRVYDNGDHTGIVWLPDGNKTIPNCRGFAVQRKTAGGSSYLHSFVGFKDGQAPPPAGQEWKWPLQRYMWWDYGVKPGDSVSYQVTAVIGDAADLKLDASNQSAWTAPLTITGQCTENISAWFNKGIVAAQWVSRALDEAAPNGSRQTALKTLLPKPGNPLRDALGGLLKQQLVQHLSDAKGTSVYAALYELNDQELLKKILALGKAMHLVLANGSFNKKDPDENVDSRKALKGKIDLHDRMVSQGHFAHNKFAVFCDKSGQPQKVLTGSTNWTWSGLCGQGNNGLIISDKDVSRAFLDEWNRVMKAGNAYPSSLAAANSKLQQFQVDGVKVTTWFAPTKDEPDMDYARKLIANAAEGILFLFFNPGTYQEDPEKETLLQNILQRHDSKSKDYNDSLYIKGVVNQEIKGLTDSVSPRNPVNLYSDGKSAPQHLNKDALTPANIKAKFHDFDDEALRASLVMVHSKVIVIDPFGDYPVVMTGSHNLGLKASAKNDDNLVILEGPAAAPIAAAYALNIIAIYQTYRWNSYVTQHAQDPGVWHGLQDTDNWQSGHLTNANLAELKFWMADHLEKPDSMAAAVAQRGRGTQNVKAQARGQINRSRS
jgi:phosphatidylserine/phosphatidylglycerophosphate/cardiolipin synthase-like enzyme